MVFKKLKCLNTNKSAGPDGIHPRILLEVKHTHTKTDSIQRTFTKRLTGMRSLSYDNRLKALGLERLELRRLHVDLITCYNIIHGHISIPFGSSFEFSTHRGTRRHLFKSFYPDPRVSVRTHCFPIRVIMLWNRLPASIVLLSLIHI